MKVGVQDGGWGEGAGWALERCGREEWQREKREEALRGRPPRCAPVGTSQLRDTRGLWRRWRDGTLLVPELGLVSHRPCPASLTWPVLPPPPAGDHWGALGLSCGGHVVPGGNGELGPGLQEQRGPAHLRAGLRLPFLGLGPHQWAGPASPVPGPAPGTAAAPQPPRRRLTLSAHPWDASPAQPLLTPVSRMLQVQPFQPCEAGQRLGARLNVSLPHAASFLGLGGLLAP